MTLKQKMKEDGYTERRVLCCPNCGEVLDDNSYDEHTEYHNSTVGKCGKCGYKTHYGYFYKTIFVKN